MVTAAASMIPRVEEDRYLALLHASNAIATCSDCSSASEMLIKQLREVTPFDSLHLVAFDKSKNAPAWSLLEVNGERIDSPSEGAPLEDSPIQWVHESGQPLVTIDWSRETRFQKYGLYLAKLGILSTCTLPLIRGP